MGGRRAAWLLLACSAFVFAISCGEEELSTPQPAATIPAAAAPTAAPVATATPVPVPTPTPLPPTSTPTVAPTAAPSPAPTATTAPAGTPTPAPTPAGIKLSKETVQALLSEFADDIFIGGQVSPRFPRWVSDDAFIFLQFNSSKPEDITELRYIGVGVKGVFCSETRPDREKGSFTHFHRYEAAKYSEGHGGQPGAQGYWMTWASLGEFVSGNRTIKPGVDYAFSLLTDIPSCGDYPPEVDFKPEDAGDLTKQEVGSLISLFGDQVLFGGQVAPRFSKWVSENAFMFLQFDKSNPADATSLRYFGLGVRGEYCKEREPSADFPHFHKYFAAKYGEGHGSQPHDLGYWLLVLAADEFKSGERQVSYGVDREFSKLVAPACG